MRSTSSRERSGSSVDTVSIGLVVAAREPARLAAGETEIAEQAEQLASGIVPRGEGLRHEAVEPVVDLPERLPDKVGHNENSSRNPSTLEHRERLLVHVPVPIVERHGSHRLRERSPTGDALADLVQTHESEVAADPVDVPLEHRAAHEHAGHLGPRRSLEVVDHPVVTEDQWRHGPSRHHRCRPASDGLRRSPTRASS
jgi:hypothetical protein